MPLLFAYDINRFSHDVAHIIVCRNFDTKEYHSPINALGALQFTTASNDVLQTKFWQVDEVLVSLSQF